MNKIGTCSMTWNPVIGCLHNCEYCYARKIVRRFWAHTYINEVNHQIKLHPNWAWTGDHLNGLKEFKPTFLDAQFAKEFPKKPQRIFVGSMSEIYYWDKLWIQNVINKIKEYPQHTFQFLTKYPETYNKWPFPEIPENCWLGTTITKMGDLNNRGIYNFIRGYDNIRNIRFVSFEPLLEKIEPSFTVGWVIIGSETGNRKGKIISKREWIEAIVNYCRDKNIPIYLKDSLKNIYPVEIKEFPKIEL